MPLHSYRQSVRALNVPHPEKRGIETMSKSLYFMFYDSASLTIIEMANMHEGYSDAPLK
jgi:hypothetical protein